MSAFHRGPGGGWHYHAWRLQHPHRGAGEVRTLCNGQRAAPTVLFSWWHASGCGLRRRRHQARSIVHSPSPCCPPSNPASFALHLPTNLPMDAAAPLLCAGELPMPAHRCCVLHWGHVGLATCIRAPQQRSISRSTLLSPPAAPLPPYALQCACACPTITRRHHHLLPAAPLWPGKQPPSRPLLLPAAPAPTQGCLHFAWCCRLSSGSPGIHASSLGHQGKPGKKSGVVGPRGTQPETLLAASLPPSQSLAG